MLHVANKTSSRIPKSGILRAIKSEVLGDKYTLNLIFVGSPQIRKLNLIYREKNESTDILSFPLSKNEGEIYICPSQTRAMSKKFGRTYENFVLFLFIHGCVHLKGYDHGGTMEHIEAGFRKKFGI